jgi:hypothetical protein
VTKKLAAVLHRKPHRALRFERQDNLPLAAPAFYFNAGRDHACQKTAAATSQAFILLARSARITLLI